MLGNILIGAAGVLVLFGSPLEESDPHMQKTFEGPAAGVGQSLAWSGKEAGKGKMTIEESVPGQKVGVKLEFVKPMASTATCALTLGGTPTGSFVTWSMDGHHNFRQSHRHVHGHGQHARHRHREGAGPAEDRRRGQVGEQGPSIAEDRRARSPGRERRTRTRERA